MKIEVYILKFRTDSEFHSGFAQKRDFDDFPIYFLMWFFKYISEKWHQQKTPQKTKNDISQNSFFSKNSEKNKKHWRFSELHSSWHQPKTPTKTKNDISQTFTLSACDLFTLSACDLFTLSACNLFPFILILFKFRRN